MISTSPITPVSGACSRLCFEQAIEIGRGVNHMQLSWAVLDESNSHYEFRAR